MVDVIIQVLATLALVLGVAAGETIATRAFGAMKKSWYYLIEIGIFVAAIVIILNSFAITELDSTLIILFYFFTGAITIAFIRAIITGFGVMSEQIKEKVLKVRKEEDYIVGLRKALQRRGLEAKEIKRIAKETGFSNDKIEGIFDFLDK
jgi:predicted TIM-barrel fold metal-dependent hydrolase